MIRLILAALASAWLLPVGGLAQDKLKVAIDPEVAAAIKTLEDPDKSVQTKKAVIPKLHKLRAKAEPAIPALKAFAAAQKDDKKINFDVVRVIARVGKPAVPELAVMMNDRKLGTWTLDAIRQEVGTEAFSLAPAILKAANAPIDQPEPNSAPGSPHYWLAAVRAVGEVGIDPKESLALYTKVILLPPPSRLGFGKPDNGYREAVLYGIRESLERIAKSGPKAKDALPALLKLLKNLQKDRVNYTGNANIEDHCIVTIGALGSEAESALPALREYRTARRNQKVDQLVEKAIDNIKGK